MADSPPFDIEVEDLQQRLATGEPVAVLDVREAWELALCRLPGSIDIPLGTLVQRAGELPRDQALVVMCHHGGRSAQATAWLRRNGFPMATNLAGGIDAWARRIDPTMKVY